MSSHSFEYPCENPHVTVHADREKSHICRKRKFPGTNYCEERHYQSKKVKLMPGSTCFQHPKVTTSLHQYNKRSSQSLPMGYCDHQDNQHDVFNPGFNSKCK